MVLGQWIGTKRMDTFVKCVLQFFPVCTFQKICISLWKCGRSSLLGLSRVEVVSIVDWGQRIPLGTKAVTQASTHNINLYWWEYRQRVYFLLTAVLRQFWNKLKKLHCMKPRIAFRHSWRRLWVVWGCLLVCRAVLSVSLGKSWPSQPVKHFFSVKVKRFGFC